MRMLALREHSRAELARKLSAHASEAEIESTLDRLSELGLLSDHRFAEAWVRCKAARFGEGRIRRELAQRGVSAEVVEAALEAEPLTSEFDRALDIWKSRFGVEASDRREWARQARFLQGRGFSTDIIRKVLREGPDESA